MINQPYDCQVPISMGAAVNCSYGMMGLFSASIFTQPSRNPHQALSLCTSNIIRIIIEIVYPPLKPCMSVYSCFHDH